MTEEAPLTPTSAFTLDHERLSRKGAPEAVYCEGKTPAQCAKAAELFYKHSRTENTGTILFTRADDERAKAILAVLPDAFYDEDAHLIAWPPEPPVTSAGHVVVVCAGTSDYPVAREAALTARFLGRSVDEIYDVGVAGIHRLLDQVDRLKKAHAVVVVAGMEGALVPVVAGLVSAPVVAVPTSVGYGVAQGGLTAVAAMLASCAPGVGVVNIDNGYGAGYLAAQIASLCQGGNHA